MYMNTDAALTAAALYVTAPAWNLANTAAKYGVTRKQVQAAVAQVKATRNFARIGLLVQRFPDLTFAQAEIAATLCDDMSVDKAVETAKAL